MSLQALLFITLCGGVALGDVLDANVRVTRQAPTSQRFFKGMVDSIRDTSKGVVDKVISGGNKVTGTIGTAVEGTLGVANTVVEGGKGVAGALLSGSKGAVDNVLDGNILGGVNSVVNAGYQVLDKVSTASLNTGADFMIAQMKVVASALGANEEGELPDIYSPLFSGAYINATNGYFRSLKNLRRPADVKSQRVGLRTLILDIPLEIDDLEIGYRNYILSTWISSTDGAIKISVGHNRVNIRLKLTLSVTCQVNLERVELTDIHGIDVDMTSSCSVCGYMTSKATTYIAGFVEGTIKDQIQAQIDAVVSNLLSNDKLPVCSKFVGL